MSRRAFSSPLFLGEEQTYVSTSCGTASYTENKKLVNSSKDERKHKTTKSRQAKQQRTRNLMRYPPLVKVFLSQLSGGKLPGRQQPFCLQLPGRNEGGSDHRCGYFRDSQSISLSFMYVFFNRAWSLLINCIPRVLGVIVGTLIKLYGALFSFPFLVKSNSKHLSYIQVANCLDWPVDVLAILQPDQRSCMKTIEVTFKSVKIIPYQ